MVAFPVLSRSNLADPSRRSCVNSRPFNLLQPLCCSPKSQLLYNQANPASFCKTPGWGALNSFASSFPSAVTCITWRLYPLWLQSVAHTSCHHGGVPLPELVPCTEAQKCLFVSPLFAALTHSVSRKSFPCHSYANTRDGGATTAPVSASVSPCLPVGQAGLGEPCGESVALDSRCRRCLCGTFRLLVQCWHFGLAPACSANRGVRREC